MIPALSRGSWLAHIRQGATAFGSRIHLSPGGKNNYKPPNTSIQPNLEKLGRPLAAPKGISIDPTKLEVEPYGKLDDSRSANPGTNTLSEQVKNPRKWELSINQKGPGQAQAFLEVFSVSTVWANYHLAFLNLAGILQEARNSLLLFPLLVFLGSDKRARYPFRRSQAIRVSGS